MARLQKSEKRGLTLARTNVNAVHKNDRSIHARLVSPATLFVHRVYVLESAGNIWFPRKSPLMQRSKYSQNRALTWPRQNVNVTIYDLIIDENYVGDIQGVPIVLLIVYLTKKEGIVDADDGEEEQE